MTTIIFILIFSLAGMFVVLFLAIFAELIFMLAALIRDGIVGIIHLLSGKRHQEISCSEPRSDMEDIKGLLWLSILMNMFKLEIESRYRTMSIFIMELRLKMMFFLDHQ